MSDGHLLVPDAISEKGSRLSRLAASFLPMVSRYASSRPLVPWLHRAASATRDGLNHRGDESKRFHIQGRLRSIALLPMHQIGGLPCDEFIR